MVEDSSYTYFYCPGCSKYKHMKFENIVRVAHLTDGKKRQDSMKNFYTVQWSWLCDECKEKAEGGSDEGG